MTHDPQLVDRLTQTMYDKLVELGGFNMSTLMTDMEICYNFARAALDAMPQPVHWGVLLHTKGVTVWQAERVDVLLADTRAEALDRAGIRMEWDAANTVTPVALVPIGD